MNKLKKLMEKRAAIVAEMEAATEKRDFDTFDTKETELRELDREIEAEKRMIELRKQGAAGSTATEPETGDEIRTAIENSEELDLRELEVRTQVIGQGGDNKISVGNIAKTTFADYIIQRLPFISPLYGATRKEVIGSASHTIPVQKTKVGKFVRMTELQKYAAQNADYNVVKLEPHKYGTLIAFSEEVLADTGYDIEADMLQQLLEAYGITLDELLVVGDSVNKVEGLNSFSEEDGCVVIEQATEGKITAEELLDIYYALPVQYRNNATWVIADDTARELSKLTFQDGTPVLFTGYNNAPVGQGSTILGKPVIINNHISKLNEAGIPVFFGDLTKALVVGPRKALTVKRSEEYGFIDDSIAVKANVRLDVKKTLGEAMAIYKGKAVGLSAKAAKVSKK
ncbi:phage major capsid protein [Clostridium perfringens]